MHGITYFTVLGFIAGIVGTGLGGVLSAVLPIKDKRGMAALLEFSGGIMLAIVCFDLLPEAFSLAGLPFVLVIFSVGVVTLMLFEELMEKARPGDKGLSRIGFIIFSAIALHDLPEGLAIGSGFAQSESLGFSLMIAILLHNIPEGISLSLPFRFSGRKMGFILFLCLLSGMPSGFGAFLGALAGGISETLIAACLAFAGGAMTYVVCGDIIPESKSLFRGRFPVLGSIAGFIVGMIIAV